MIRTVSLETAKQLKAAGFPQKSEFYWEIFPPDPAFNQPERINLVGRKHTAGVMEQYYYAAPTAEEVLDQLPKEIIGDEGTRHDLNIWLSSDAWFIAYWWDEDSRRKSDLKVIKVEGVTLAEAAAKMWLYLKKENLI